MSKKLNSKFIFVSNNFRFGNKKCKFITKKSVIYNYKVIKPKPLIKNKKIVSSSLIRNLLEKGFLKKANKLLKRNWSIEGTVKKGRQVGKKLAFQHAILISKIMS